ncbi:DUF4232 domain-containing protein [Streptomyces sp. TRM43335]|uniref:DUF4232 domain-containing protein n=1 Tax=Streptomyces taklimakanensis TaxID=2569853 RepID=A0A6G2BJC6_9ACTN|nr:DUF4232 domain-containing protein [Streptomyces taklimakanensis]MTE22350.1 DUF4232 domain-containing protein [Streptomyces taklimakanensis]
MRSIPLALPAVLAGALLLTACGSQKVVPGNDGSTRARASGSPGPPADPSCGPRPSEESTTSGAPPLFGDSPAPEEDGIRIIDSSGDTRGCVTFQVTNHEAEPFTYTITFSFLSDSGEALTRTERTVLSVGARQTAEHTVSTDGLPPDVPDTARVRITEVRTVPTDETFPEGGPCPPSGTRVYTDDGDAAMGLRVVGLHLENCGTRAIRLDGYPRVQPLDEDHDPVTTVRVLHGGSTIATGTGIDGPPRPLVLEPGERARAGLVWRNTVEAGVGDPVDAPYARVWAKPGAAPMTVTPEFDLGTTGKLGVGPWEKDGTSRSATGGASGGWPPRPSSGSTAPARP